MSLATRCPACGTIFRVVQDQLKVSEGWVRCGQCHEVFHGIEALFDLDSDPAIAARRAAARHPVAPPPTRVFADARASAPIPMPLPPRPAPPAPVAIPARTPPPVPSQHAVPATPSAFGPSELPPTGPAPLGQRGFTPATRPLPPPPPPAAPVPGVSIRGTIAPRFAARLAEEAARAQAAASPSPIPSPFIETAAVPPMAPPPPFGSALVQHASEAAPLPQTEELLRGPITFAPIPVPPPAPDFAPPPAPTFAPTPVHVNPPVEAAPMPFAELVTEPIAEPIPAPVATPTAAEMASAFAAPQSFVEPAPEPSPVPVAAPEPAPIDDTVHEVEPIDAAPLPEELDVEVIVMPVLPDVETDDEEARAGPPTLASMLPEDAGEWPPKSGTRKKRERPAGTEVALVDNRKDPRFLREARSGARWRKPWVRAVLSLTLVLLAATALGQWAWPQRDVLASRWPATLPAWAWACEQAGCRIEAPRAIASLALDGSSLTRTDTDHVLLFSADLHNRADHEVRMPSFDLTFMDLNGEVVARKVLTPAQIGIRLAALPPEGELHVHARLQVGGLDATGFQADLFYP